MQPGGIPFEHWSYRLIGGNDTALSAASLTLLSRLLARARLRQTRAWLYRHGLPPSIRQALRLDLGAALDLSGVAGRFHALWLVEQSDGKVFGYGAERALTRLSIGGRLLPTWPFLDAQSPWVADLAERLATLTLPSPAASRAAPGRPSERWMLSQVELALLRAALGAFLSGLDADVLAVVRAEGSPLAEVYNHYRAPEPRVRRNRLQAAQTYPWLATELRLDWSLRRLIETGRPLAPALAARCQVKPRTLARTRTLAPPPGAAARKALLRRLDALPADYFPRDCADWAAFQSLAERLGLLAETLDVAPLKLLKPFRAGWQRGLVDLARQTGAPLDLEAIFEMMHAAYHDGVRPALMTWKAAGGLSGRAIPRQAPASFYPLWFGRYGLGRLATLAQGWRQAMTRLSLERLGVVGENDGTAVAPLSWPAVLSTGHTLGDFCIHELTTQAALEQEGHRLQHCVGSYAATCLMEGSGIYSVRDRLGRSCSTFEVRLGGSSPVLVQHKALRNSTPPAPEQALVARFLDQVLAKVPPERIAANHEERRRIAKGASALLAHLAVREENGELHGIPPEEIANAMARLCLPLHPTETRLGGIPVFLSLHGEALLRSLPADDAETDPLGDRLAWDLANLDGF